MKYRPLEALDKINEPLKRKTPLTFEERMLIENYISQGYSLTQISKKLSRGANTIVTEVRKNGGRDNYKPLEAHKRNELVLKTANEIRSIEQKNKVNPYVKISDRVDFLEMQIEILVDSIKQLREQNEKD